ncbi:MAG: hypothetical protein KDA80_13455 [Planctomycetaceae bacterium]|nr:hypothetical protein [Planctomycetaceae bacterium]
MNWTAEIPKLLILGQIQRMEAAVGVATGLAHAIVTYPGVEEALADQDFVPDLVLVLQHSPDEYSPDEVELLLSKFPASRFSVCLGPWCASYGRTRRYWPLAVTVFEDKLAERLKREAEVIHGIREPLPWSANWDEVFAFDHS